MSNEVKLEDAKPGMWAEFDIIENKKDIKTGHYLLELQSVPVKSVEDLMYLVLADALHGGRIIYSLGVDLDDGMIPIIDGEHEPMPYADNLHVYAEKPEPPTSDTDVPEGFTAIGTIKVMPGDAHDLANIPTEPGLYRAATGSTWYYDGESWTPITDHNGEYTYAQKQSYKRFIETSLASHRVPFTPVSLPEPGKGERPAPPTEPGWYLDNEKDVYWYDGELFHRLCAPMNDEYLPEGLIDYYGPLTRIDDIDSYLRKECCGQA